MGLEKPNKRKIANAICSFVAHPPPKIGQLNRNYGKKITSDNRLKLKETCEIKKSVSTVFAYFDRAFRRQAAACNEHIAKIAALPRVDKKSVFLRLLLALIKCWEAATSAICHHVSGHAGTVPDKLIEKLIQYIMSKRKKGHADFIKWFGPILDALRALGGSAKPREIVEWIGTTYEIPDEVLNARYEKSGLLKFQNQISWARQYLVWEELLDSSKHGVWALTPKGWNSTLNEKESHEIFLKWVAIFQDFREKNESLESDTKKVVTVQEITESEEGQHLISPSLLEVLQSISAIGFEHLCGRLLKEYNFEDIEITQRSHDGGIDGYATLKLNPFVSLSVAFQCKRYQGTVPTEKVHAFTGAIMHSNRSVDKLLMITTGNFAKSALENGKANNKLELIDGEKLVEMFENVELGVIPKTVYEPDMKFFEQFKEMK